MATTAVVTSGSRWTERVAMDAAGRVQRPRAGLISAERLRIALGLVSLRAFVVQGLRVGCTNTDAPAGTPAGRVTHRRHFSG